MVATKNRHHMIVSYSRP